MAEPLPASPEHPVYGKVPQDRLSHRATQKYMITCDEGWRCSIVCTDMYAWAADWLLSVLGRQPYAPDTRPGA